MRIKPEGWKYEEFIGLGIVYTILVVNAFVLRDNIAAVFSAFFGVTYTMLAGKGNPKCYLFGIAGSGLYGWISFCNAIWGNLCLYILYYIPMQITGFYKWNQHLNDDKKTIVKIKVSSRERLVLAVVNIILITAAVFVLYAANDKSPVIDGIVTILSVTGMYLTVRRALEQWFIWIIVNGLTAVMWIQVALSGEKVYSAVLMWLVYFILAIYFYRVWKKEVV